MTSSPFGECWGLAKRLDTERSESFRSHVSQFLIEQSNKWQVRHRRHDDRLCLLSGSRQQEMTTLHLRMVSMMIVADIVLRKEEINK
jgi:hypothetical protein